MLPETDNAFLATLGLPWETILGNNGRWLILHGYEPPEGYELVDVFDDMAYYRPKTLNLRQLTLTSLGGTFRHDTAFQPPAAVQTMSYMRAFDSLAIERPSESRIREALALGDVKMFVVACPKDTVMYTSAVQNLGATAQIEVRDIIDLVRA